MNEFDLNIEKILENWEVYHAIREIIANALDEQMLTKTAEVEIFEDEKHLWHIRDYGRGLSHVHLTQKENEEKLKNPHMIGKFGIGLKDALATFDRKQVTVTIQSKYGIIKLAKRPKHGFNTIKTLHALIDTSNADLDFKGTDVILEGVTKNDIEEAKNLFLRFSGEPALEDTRYGTILKKKGQIARIFINGVKVAEEEKFLFSYNITSLTTAIKKALNRERSNVGRSAYSDRVKGILLEAKNEQVAKTLIGDLQHFSQGTMHDELKWIDVQEHSVKILNAQKKNVVFLTPEESIRNPNMVDEARSGGFEIVMIPENLKEKVRGTVDIKGNPIRDLGGFIREYNESFQFKFVDEDQLTPSERHIFALLGPTFDLIGGRPTNVREVKISENMKKEGTSFTEPTGLWESGPGRIILKRTALHSIKSFGDTVLHETAHAISRAPDVDRAFETELSRLLGILAEKLLRNKEE